MITTILFLIVLSILVFIHELGHFLFAKLFKVRVDEFAIGFPPRIFSFKKGETVYALNALPLGGYVKIHGENPDDKTDKEDKRNFQNISWWKQILILAAAVIFNILFAWFLMSMTLFIGTDKVSIDSVNSKYIQGEKKVIILQVMKDSVADKAGIKAGDRILNINNTQINNLNETVLNLKYSPKDLNIVLYRNNATTTIDLIKGEKDTIGVALAETAKVKMGIFASSYYGAKATYNLTVQIFEGVLNFFAKIFTGNGSWDEVSGPVGIAKVVGDSGRQGILRINFVNAFNGLGFLLLLLLMLVVTFKDIF